MYFLRIRAGWVLSVEKFTRFQGTHTGMGSRMCSKKLQLDSLRLTECQCDETKDRLSRNFLRTLPRRSSWLMRFIAKLVGNLQVSRRNLERGQMQLGN